MTETQTQEPCTNGSYCSQCGAQYDSSKLIKDAVDRKVDDLAKKLNAQLDLGEISSKRKASFDNNDTADAIMTLLGGTAKIAAAYVAANNLFPGHQGAANFVASLYVTGLVFGGISRLTREDATRDYMRSMQDRLRAHFRKEDQ